MTIEAKPRVHPMGNPEGPTERIDTLRVLMDRLCSPDLTLDEAKSLRSLVLELLERNGRKD